MFHQEASVETIKLIVQKSCTVSIKMQDSLSTGGGINKLQVKIGRHFVDAVKLWQKKNTYLTKPSRNIFSITNTVRSNLKLVRQR